MGRNQSIVTQSGEQIKPHKKQVWYDRCTPQAANKSSRTRSKIQDRAIIIHATRSSEHKSNFTAQVSISRVYENAHRVSENITLQYREQKSKNKDMKNHSYLNRSKQKTDIIKAHVLHPEYSFLHMIRERERDPSLGSQRVSQWILGNPRLRYT
jgi:hypothetical protein